jgi:8-oxo-dGTP diphosphatase
MTQYNSDTEDILEVAAAVIMSGDLMLACRRQAGGPHGGKWEFPGGKREAGETLEQCLRRELQEELNIDAEIGVELWRTTHQYPGQSPIQLVFFHVPQYSGHLINRTFANMSWLPIGDLAELDFLEADRSFIDQLDRREVQLP